MYKKPEGKTGFSFGRLITNAVPNFANSNAKDDSELSLEQQDRLFAHQIKLENPKVLDNMSFFACSVVGKPTCSSFCASQPESDHEFTAPAEAKTHSASVLKSLKKVGIVSPTDGSVHTEKITKHFANQVPEISIHRQRKLVALLFFWEEELVRWRLLDEEEAEIKKTMETHGEEHEQLKVALGTVWVRRSTPPSQRSKEGNQQGAQQAPPPPDYGDTVRTVGIKGGKYEG